MKKTVRRGSKSMHTTSGLMSGAGGACTGRFRLTEFIWMGCLRNEIERWARIITTAQIKAK
ncbi:hypothetical protein [Rubrivivax sp. A210]|uniref:hypothetical protein n=1 Tax=Rubrivivax sp. A210 TaxID=2772301 RepID=UPI001917B205|nr:hypothetical protein [Rubrivivax sp. A210]